MIFTIREFFDSVYDYAAKNADLYTDEQDKQELKQAIEKLKKIQEKIEYIAKSDDISERYREGIKVNFIEVNQKLFIKPNSNDNHAYSAFLQVIRGIVIYYQSISAYGDWPDYVLKPVKQWYIKTSNNSVILNIKRRVFGLLKSGRFRG